MCQESQVIKYCNLIGATTLVAVTQVLHRMIITRLTHFMLRSGLAALFVYSVYGEEMALCSCCQPGQSV